MPLFANKFASCKTPPRKLQMQTTNGGNYEFKRNEYSVNPPNGSISNTEPITLKLNGFKSVFENGNWSIDSEDKLDSNNRTTASTSNKEVRILRESNQQLHEENNLLKLKIEILLDMLAETTAEVHILSNDAEVLKSTPSTNFKVNHKKR